MPVQREIFLIHAVNPVSLAQLAQLAPKLDAISAHNLTIPLNLTIPIYKPI
jgi:hypothetical protein